MVAKTDLSTFNCSLARALSVMGDWWSLLIVRDAFLGSSRFGEFQKSLGIARNILATRLDALVEAGILTRAGTDTRPTYQLALKGREMAPALVALMQWGDKWESANHPPMLATDENGASLMPLRLRNRSGEIVAAEGIRFYPGPGATPRTRAFLEARLPRKPARG